MKIDANIKTNLSGGLLDSTQTKSQKTKTVDTQKQAEIFDKVELSSKKIDAGQLIEKINATPGIRQDKVDAIREAISNGTYTIRGDLVAKSILKNSLLDEII
jgi:negative regulator of flagellin synthesis FlgM